MIDPNSSDVARAGILCIRPANALEVEPVKAILDGERRIFGFIPRPAVAGAQQQGTLLVATLDDRIVGFARIRHRRDEVTTLYEITVLPKMRRCGIGRSLVMAIIAEATACGKCVVRLKCPVDLPANLFYARLGFTLSEQQAGKRAAINVWNLYLLSDVTE